MLYSVALSSMWYRYDTTDAMNQLGVGLPLIQYIDKLEARWKALLT